MEELKISTQMLQNALSDVVNFHIFFSAFFAFAFVKNLISLFSFKNYVALNKKIWFVMPMIFFLIAISTLSGLSLSAMQSQIFSPKILLMIFFNLFVLFGEIIRIKKLKVALRTDTKAMEEYVRFCKILYISNLVLFGVVMLWR